MKRTVLFLTFLLIGFSLKAQWFDYGAAALQIQAENAQMINNTLNQAFGIMAEQQKQMEKTMTATALFIPGSHVDKYSAFVMISYAGGINNLILKYTDDDDNTYKINLNECFVCSPYILLPEYFQPGYKLSIQRSIDNKTICSETIPSKQSSNYPSFIRKACKNSTFIASVLGGSSNNSYKSTSHQRCPYCKGEGSISYETNNPYVLGERATEYKMCPRCMGSGYVKE